MGSEVGSPQPLPEAHALVPDPSVTAALRSSSEGGTVPPGRGSRLNFHRRLSGMCFLA